jgi:hypothetical protein
MEGTQAAVDRYLELRATQRRLNDQLIETLSRRAIEESAKRLGLFANGRLALEYDEDVAVLYDAAIYDHSVAGVSAVSRLFARTDVVRTRDESLVLRAMLDAYPTLLEVVEPISGYGAVVFDVLADREEELADIELSESGEPGDHLVARLLTVDDVTMTTGAAMLLDTRAAQMIAQAPPLPASGRHPRYRAVVATNLYRLALSDGEDASELFVAMAMRGGGAANDQMGVARAVRSRG